MFEYLFARHRNDYIRLALHHKTSPDRIWRLAHGHSAENSKDTQILHDLLDLGIIYRHKRSRKAEDYVMDDE